MQFARVLIVIDASDALGPVLAAAQWLAPMATAIHLVVLAVGNEAQHRVELDRALKALTPLPATSLEVIFYPGDIARVSAERPHDLTVVGPWRTRPPRERVLAMLDLTAQSRGPVLSVGTAARVSGRRRRVLGLLLDGLALPTLRAAAEVANALPDFPHVIAFAVGGDQVQLDDLEAGLQALLPGRVVELQPVPWSLVSAVEDVERAARERRVDLLVAPRPPGRDPTALVNALFAAQTLQDAERPFLVMRVEASTSQRLYASDALLLPGAPLRVALERVGAFGRLELPLDAHITLPALQNQSALRLEGGVAVIQAAVLGTGAGVHTLALALETAPEQVAVCQLIDRERPTVLVDSKLAFEHFADLDRLASHCEVVFVRLRGDEPLQQLRARLHECLPWGGPVFIVDASAWLDDGGASDVSRSVDALRLLRLALQLRALGARCSTLITSDEYPLCSPWVTCCTPSTLASLGALRMQPAGVSALDPLTVRCGAGPVTGNTVSLELDNRMARRELVEAANAARRSIHLQSYIFEDAAVVREVCDALVGAASRGVAVRVLADALYSLHHAFGTANAVLQRLSRASGVEVRAYQPLTGMPTLAELKQRNHRKLVVVDGARAWVTGRNLGATYYEGFDEARVSATSTIDEVPWLDASAKLEGPLVAQVEAAFLTDWLRAGGAPFAVSTPPPAGNMVCRLVLHEGLADTHSLEAQRCLIERATERLVLVSTFPLVIDLQRALLAALRRGVRVQLLFGNVRPRWSNGRPFQGGAYRELGDELVRSRLEPVLRAGAEGYELALTPRGGWSPNLGRVFPHVHAKLMARDACEVAVGSANVDVTSAYWESEALLWVHDAAFARSTVAALEPLLSESRRVDLTTGDWEPRRASRAWLGRHWPPIIG